MSIKVSIVQQDPVLREKLKRVVDESAECVCSGSYDDCGMFFAELDENVPHVVVMDVSPAECSSAACTQQLKDLQPEVELLMLADDCDEEKMIETFIIGASGYVLKGSPPERILAAIQGVHHGDAAMPPSFARVILKAFLETRPRITEDYHLSAREHDVLEGLVEGMSYKMIAEKYSISLDTVRTHIKHIYEKLHVHSKSEAVVKALRKRLL
jgi:DNA-binding NarL/FixJ family response regulator